MNKVIQYFFLLLLTTESLSYGCYKNKRPKPLSTQLLVQETKSKLEIEPQETTKQLTQKLKILIGQNNLSEAQKLLAAHPEIANTNFNGSTPLIIAAEKHTIDFLQLLLAHKADPNQSTRISKRTPFMHATLFGSEQGMQVLLAHKANPNAQNKAGKTAQQLFTCYVEGIIQEALNTDNLPEHIYAYKIKELEKAQPKDDLLKNLKKKIADEALY